MPDSDKPAANETMQIDALDLERAAEGEPALAARASVSPSRSEPAPSRRKTPPPLPPSAFVSNPPPEPASPVDAPPVVSRAPTVPPPRSPVQKAIVIAVFVVVAAGAIAGGLFVGNSARDRLASPGPAAASGASPGAAAPSASDNVLMLPTIEMSSQPAGN